MLFMLVFVNPKKKQWHAQHHNIKSQTLFLAGEIWTQERFYALVNFILVMKSHSTHSFIVERERL